MANNYNQGNRPQPTPPTPPQPQQIDPAMIQQLLENQKLEALNEANKTRVKEKEIEANSSYAHESLKYQAEFLKAKPSQDRKTMLLVSGITAFFVILLMAFVLYCLHVGEKELVLSVLKGIGWIGSSVLSYYLGQNKANKTKQSNSEVSDAEVVN